MIRIPVDFLARKLNCSAEELRSALTTDSDDALTKEQIKELESKFDSTFDAKFQDGKKEGHGEALRKTLSDREKEFAETYGVKQGSFIQMGKDLADKLKEANSKIDENDVKNSEVFIDSIREKEAEIKALKEQIEDQRSKFEWNTLVDKAKKTFISAVSEKYDISNIDLVDLVFERTVSGDVIPSLNADGELIMIHREDGKPLRSKGAELVKYSDFILNEHAAKYLHPVDPTAKTPGGTTVASTKYSFKTFAEASAALDKATTDEEKDAIIEASKSLS